MDGRTNHSDYRVSLEICFHAIRRIFDLHAYYAQRESNRIGQKGKPRQSEESGDIFVVFMASYGAENKEQGREGQSNRVQNIDTTDVVAVGNWCS